MGTCAHSRLTLPSVAASPSFIGLSAFDKTDTTMDIPLDATILAVTFSHVHC